MKKVLLLSLTILLISSCPSFAGKYRKNKPPRVFNIQPERYVQAKARIQAGEAALKPILDEIISKAEEALTKEPNSVMDKRAMPFTLDKHDYMSIRPYRWPDPNHKYGVPYLVRDGVVNPEARGTGQYDRGNFGRMIHSVSDLAQAYYFTEDEKYAEYAINWLRIWFLNPATRMNPHLRYAQAYPGCLGELGAGIVDADGLPNVVDAIGLLETSKHWTKKDRAGMENWFYQFLKWLRTSEQGQLSYNTHSNHGLGQDAQIVSYALFIGDVKFARDALENAKKGRIARQIRPDGGMPRELERTKSFNYTCKSLNSLFRLATMGEQFGIDLWNHESNISDGPFRDAPGKTYAFNLKGGSIKKALDYIAPYADPEKIKDWPHKQIKPASGMRLLGLLRRAAIAYNDPHYEELIDKLPKDKVATHWIQLFYPKEPLTEK